MSDEWLTSEPEVGQVAWLKNDPPFGPVICYIGDRGKAWKFAHGAKCLCDPSCPPWLPITTPGEDRLKAEVDRLREGIRNHQDKVMNGIANTIDQYAIDGDLWQLLETEAGGVGDE